MNREQLKLLYQKLAPRLRLLLLTLAALGGFLFAVFLFRQIFSWQISYFRNLATLRSPLPVAEERNTAETEPGTDAGEEKESGSMGSYTAQATPAGYGTGPTISLSAKRRWRNSAVRRNGMPP